MLFAVLIFALIWNIVKEKKIGMLLPFFLIPIVMIGYPSIGSIQYEKGKFQLQPLVGKLMAGDISEGQLEEFMKAYEMVAQSCKSSHDPEAQATLAQAQLITGNYEQAQRLADRSLSLQPQNRAAMEIRELSMEQIRRKGDFNERINRLGRVMDEIESGELRHSQGVNQLQEILADANPPQNIETESALILAKALAYTGQKESAITMAEQLLQQPGISVEEREKAQELKANIESGSFELSQITLPQEIIRLENILEQPVINPALSPELLDQQGFVRRINPNADLER